VVAVRNEGTASLRVSAVSSGTGQVVAEEDPSGGGAVRFPAFSAAPAATAVLVAVDDLDALEPGDRDFSFGAAFSVDARSSGSTTDDGNNLLQRGGYVGGQFKIQVDQGVPSCRVAGDAGEVFVEADEPVAPDRWYTVTCERTISQVRLTLTPRGRGERSRTWSATGAIGTVSFEQAPVAIGGKVAPDGGPVASADQFNGIVDDVFVQVD
jgi:hypothetical protein